MSRSSSDNDRQLQQVSFSNRIGRLGSRTASMGEIAPSPETITTMANFIRPQLDPRDPSNPFSNILDLIEHNASQNPTHTFALQLLKRESSTGILAITHRQLKDLILALAELFKEDAPPTDDPSPAPIALLMESDASLIVYVFALMHLGIPVLLLSARLSPVAIQHLLTKTGADTLVASSGLKVKAEEALALASTSTHVDLEEQMPFESLLGQAQDQSHSHALGGNCSEDRNAIIFHSSGTTGMPKPIYHTSRYFLAFATCHAIPDAPSGPCFSTLPLFHAFGWVPPCLALSIGMPVCFPPRSTIPNARAMSEQLQLTQASYLVSVPSILEDFAASPELAERALAQLGFVAFGGGKLKGSAGQALAAKGVKLLNHFGATESGPLAPLFVPDEKYDWHYFRLRSDAQTELRSTGLDADGREQFQLTIRPLGWDRDFQLQDHLVRNPASSFPDYNAVGRKDDVLVLANGEKVQPGIVEAAVIEEPSVKAVVAFGNGQAEIGLLLQPAHHVNVEDREAFVDSVWPTIAKANLLMDAHAQVTSKHCVLVVPHDAVLPRSDKGSLMRREVYAMFDEGIKQVYASLEALLVQDTTEQLRADRLEDDISEVVHKYTRVRNYTYQDDLFELGLDSLQAVQLRRRLQAASSKSEGVKDQQLSRDFVYRCPSIKQMANALKGEAAEEDDFAKLVDQYSRFPEPFEGSRDSHAALVTGATGGLGSHVVAHLARLRKVHTVYCLVRPRPGADATKRMVNALADKGIRLTPTELEKVRVLECNTSQENLGLTEDQYRPLMTNVEWIVHAAWPMDFKLKLASFSNSFRSLQNLLTLARSIDMTHGHGSTAKFLFVSSIATVGRWSDVTGECLIPEQRVQDHESAVDIGYAKAKLVCENIIERALAEASNDPAQLPLSVQYARVGQLVGSSQTGLWNEEEHFPALVKSSQAIGALPTLTGTLSWIPVDSAAEVVCDALMSETELRPTVFHVENPVRQSWGDMMSAISAHLAIPTVPYQEWLHRLGDHTLLDENANPAAKLLPFFEEQFERMACGSVTLDTFVARSLSPTLRRLGTISDADVMRFIERWRESGFLK